MKRICAVLFLFNLFILVSCGGGGSSSMKKNELLGNIPSVIAEYNAAMSDLEKWGDSKRDEKDAEKLMKLMQEYKEKEEAIEQKAINGLNKEFEGLKEKELPVVNENSDFDVSGLKMEKANIGNVIFRGEITTKTTLIGTSVNCEFQDKDGNVIQAVTGSIKHSWSGWGKHEIPAGSYEFHVTLDITDQTADVAKLVFVEGQK